MDNSLTQKAGATAAAARTAIRDIGTASSEVGGAAKKAGADVRKVTADQMAVIKSDIDAFVAELPGLSDIDLSAAKQRLLDNYSVVRNTANDYRLEAQRKVTEGVDAGGEYIKAKPLQSMAVAAGVGFLLGAFIARR